MQKNVKNIIKYILFSLLAIYLLYVSFEGINWTDFWRGLKECSWIYVIAAMLAGLSSFFFRGIRWRMLLNTIDKDISIYTCFNATNISALVNMGIPRAGELIRCAVITKSSKLDEKGERKASYDKVLGTAILDRIWDVIVLFILVFYILIGMGGPFSNFIKEEIFQKLSQKLVLSPLSILIIISSAIILFLFISYFIGAEFLSKVNLFLKGIVKGLISCFKIKRSWLFLLYTFIIWLMYFLMSYFILLAVKGIDPLSMPQYIEGFNNLSQLGWQDALFLMIAGALSSLVPVPGGVGAFHLIVTMCIAKLYGIPQGLGIIFATLSHEAQLLLQLIAGSISYIIETYFK